MIVKTYEEALNNFEKLLFKPPFSVSGYYINDSRGQTIVECGNIYTAKALMNLLNNLPPPLDKEVTKNVEKVSTPYALKILSLLDNKKAPDEESDLKKLL